MDLKEGEVICDKCNGSGLYDNNYKPKESVFIMYECMYCAGEGSIDWITDILGKNDSYHIRKIRMHRNEYEYRTRRNQMP
jgi:DnaJ-class molecular chaperone